MSRVTADRVRAVVRDLPPVYFALVMATGTISMALHEVGRDGMSTVLLVVDVLSYAALAVLTVWRVVFYRS
ncbi:MAG: tellurite resistance protein permease, partial [Actinomycetia bacterium]|nr:tellurite resistance protein permease [Actinomycetes bacterium]